MKTIELSKDFIVSSIENNETILTVRSGEKYRIKITDKENRFEIHFVNECGSALTSEPFEVLIFKDGIEEILLTNEKGIIALESINNVTTLEVMIPAGTNDTFRELLESSAGSTSEAEGEKISADESTRFIYVRDKLVEEKIEVPPTVSDRFTICVKPFILMARMEGMHFEKNKCFMLPSAVSAMRNMVHFYNENPNTTLLLVGHTDTSGEVEYNDILSLERANTIAAYLKDDVDHWLSWYSSDVSWEKKWSNHEDGLMLSVVLAEETLKTIGQFQKWHNNLLITEGSSNEPLPEHGYMDEPTRKALIMRYMDQDGTSLPMDVAIETHGCGEHFPLDESEKKLDSAPADGTYDITDRRVELFFFDSASGITPPPPGKNSSAESTEYIKWREKARVVWIGSLVQDALILYVLDSSYNALPAGTPYRVTINSTVREGVLTVPGQIIETGIMFEDAQEALVEWGKFDEWGFENKTPSLSDS